MSSWRIAQMWSAGLLLLTVVLLAAYGAGALDWLDEPININKMR